MNSGDHRKYIDRTNKTLARNQARRQRSQGSPNQETCRSYRRIGSARKDFMDAKTSRRPCTALFQSRCQSRRVGIRESRKPIDRPPKRSPSPRQDPASYAPRACQNMQNARGASKRGKRRILCAPEARDRFYARHSLHKMDRKVHNPSFTLGRIEQQAEYQHTYFFTISPFFACCFFLPGI
jgi:hypothetical protein